MTLSKDAALVPAKPTQKIFNLHGAIFVALAIVLVALPHVLAVLPPLGISTYVLSEALCFALFATAFNMLLGFGGLLSFGHAMYFGSASYICAQLMSSGVQSLPFWLPKMGWVQIPIGLPPFTPELAILTGALVAGLLGLVTGALAIRRQGIYFAMVTLALAQMVYFFCSQAPFTGGENGLQTTRNDLFGFIDIKDDLTLYYMVAVIFIACFLLIHRIIHSPFGEVLKAIRENEPRAISLGYKVNHYKLMVFVLSATLAGVAGGTKAVVAQVASLTDVHWTMSGEVILMTLVGGMGTIFGPMFGAAIIFSIQNYLADLGSWATIVQGGIFVMCVLLFKEGIIGVLAKIVRRPL